MTESHKAIIEKMAEEMRKPHHDPDEYWYPNSVVMKIKTDSFIAGAAAYDELIQLEIERLKGIMEKLFKENDFEAKEVDGLIDVFLPTDNIGWQQFCKENDIPLPTNSTT